MASDAQAVSWTPVNPALATTRVLAATTALLLLLTGCASAPLIEHETRQAAHPKPEETPIGAYFADAGADEPDKSGILLLDDPREAFKARFMLAKRATRTLDMQYYLWKGDLAGRLLLWSALDAADRGVKVRLLIDDIYHSGRDDVYRQIAMHPNFDVRIFNPMKHRRAGRNLNYVLNRAELNHRMHNKIFLVDNAATVMGGRNIGNDYFGVDPSLNFHDLDVLAVGPVAKEAGAAFDMYWNSRYAVPIERLNDKTHSKAAVTEARAALDKYLDDELGALPYRVPADPEAITAELDRLSARLTWARARVVVDPLDRFSGGDSALAALVAEIEHAADEVITVQTAYLIPSDETIAGIERLTNRGVRIRMMTNSLMSNNHVSVHGHYAKHRDDLLEAGAELYEARADDALLDHYRQQDERLSSSHSGMHTKAFVVDDDLSIIGSYNMDPRSRIWNSEISLVVYGEEFGRKVLDVMEERFAPENAYRVFMNDDGKIRWRLDCDGCTEQWTKDPESSFWKRFAAGFIGMIPIGNEL